MGKNNFYFLLDLERTVHSGKAFFWMSNKHGYTYNLEEAGIYNEAAAEKIVQSDFDKRTIMIKTEIILKLLDT